MKIFRDCLLGIIVCSILELCWKIISVVVQVIFALFKIGIDNTKKHYEQVKSQNKFISSLKDNYWVLYYKVAAYTNKDILTQYVIFLLPQGDKFIDITDDIQELLIDNKMKKLPIYLGNSKAKRDTVILKNMELGELEQNLSKICKNPVKLRLYW